MVVCAVVLFYTLFSSFVQCSSIITRSMIRTPNGSFSTASRPMTPSSQLPKPEMLTSRTSQTELQAVHPFKSEEEQKIGFESLVSDKSIPLENTSIEHFVQLNSLKAFPNSDIENHASKIIQMDDTKTHEDKVENPKEPARKLNTTISPKELSSKYWMQYNNFSHDYFNKWTYHGTPNNETKLEKRYPETGLLEMIQRIISCFWTSELFSCVQNSFGDTSFESFPLFNLISPRLPRFQIEDDVQEGFTNRNGDYEYSIVEEDEGRKKLSKKLLQIIPFLLMLKMTMLPALAVMALVSGKAFLMSLLSLGVALVATFSSAVPFTRADKRHEIAPQSPASSYPTEQVPSKYYYAM